MMSYGDGRTSRMLEETEGSRSEPSLNSDKRSLTQGFSSEDRDRARLTLDLNTRNEKSLQDVAREFRLKLQGGKID